MSVADATIEMHPHANDEREFFCYCAKHHRWGERGTRTFRIPTERHLAYGYQMILCPCGTWHIKSIAAESAENIIKENQ